MMSDGQSNMQKRCCWYWMYRTQRKRSCEGDTVPWLASGKAMVLMMVVVEVVVVVAVVGKGVVVGASGWEDKYMWNIRWGRGHMGKNTVWKKKLHSEIMLIPPDVWPAASCASRVCRLPHWLRQYIKYNTQNDDTTTHGLIPHWMSWSKTSPRTRLFRVYMPWDKMAPMVGSCQVVRSD